MLHNNHTGYAHMVRIKQILAALILCVLTAVSVSPAVDAGPQQSKSTNYGVSEVNFGSGGDVHVCSNSYCSKQSAGELTVGNTKSSNYQAQAGFNTDRQPLLEVSVNGGQFDLGVLDSTTVKYASTTFSVRTYPAYGYNVIISGQSPANNAPSAHVLTPMSTADVSRPGTEQFGINLKQNTTPAVGADPQQVPDSTFSFGAPATGYGTADNFKFNNGDIIAQSPKSSGQTTFTMSMIENVATTTPGGAYYGQLALIVTPTF